MRFERVATFSFCMLSVGCVAISAHAASTKPQRVSVCQLSHFGASSDGKLYETRAIYSTVYRHGAYLMSVAGPHCGIQLGVRQSDVDGSVARFDKTLLQTKAKHGLAANRIATVVLVFHWVNDSSGQELDAFGRPWSARGVVELTKVLSSAYYNHPN